MSILDAYKVNKDKRLNAAGIDVGGTKIELLDQNDQLHRFATGSYPDMYAVLDDFFTLNPTQPTSIAVAMAGPRNDRSGEISLTNVQWPIFNPSHAEDRYPGIHFITIHDVGATAAGITLLPDLDTIPLKAGQADLTGPKLAITLSTGVGVSVAIWDEISERYIYFSGEAGHIGFRPSNEAELRHHMHLSKKYAHPSIELAISGKYGMQNWLEHSPELRQAKELDRVLKAAIAENQPLGAVLLAYATESSGMNRVAAVEILNNMGNLFGNYLADLALIYKATGGIYLTGSVSIGLSEYWAQHTSFGKVFVRHGTPEHAPWLADLLGSIPIYLISDSHIGVRGAKALALQWIENNK